MGISVSNLTKVYGTQRAIDAVKGHPRFGFNYDPSHFGYQGVDYIAFLTKLSQRIYHVHMKDVYWSDKPTEAGVFGGHLSFGDRRRFWDFRSPGRGAVDFEEIIRALQEADGGWINAFGWSNIGIERYFDEYFPRTAEQVRILSIGGFGVEEFMELVDVANRRAGTGTLAALDCDAGEPAIDAISYFIARPPDARFTWNTRAAALGLSDGADCRLGIEGIEVRGAPLSVACYRTTAGKAAIILAYASACPGRVTYRSVSITASSLATPASTRFSAMAA